VRSKQPHTLSGPTNTELTSSCRTTSPLHASPYRIHYVRIEIGLESAGRLPLVDMLDTQLSFYTAAAASSPPGGRCLDEDASPALRSIVQQAQKMRLESARCPPAFRFPPFPCIHPQASEHIPVVHICMKGAPMGGSFVGCIVSHESCSEFLTIY